MPTFQLTITVILCPSNTVKSFCNAWHLLYFTFYLHLKFHCRCFAAFLFRWEAMKGWGLDSCCVSVTCPFTFAKVLSRWCWMFESCQILLAEFDFSTEKMLLFSHFSTYINITYINSFTGTWRFWSTWCVSHLNKNKVSFGRFGSLFTFTNSEIMNLPYRVKQGMKMLLASCECLMH